jgi:hypothetical protein
MQRLRDPQWALILMFLGIIVTVPLTQAVLELRQDRSIHAFDILGQLPTSSNLRQYERSLESACWAAQWSRPWIQFAQFHWLKDGGEKVVVGRDGWYFYRPGLRYMVERPDRLSSADPQDDPLEAIIDFRDQLAARGVRLILMPVPNKESFYPDRLTARARNSHGVLAPRTREFLDRLRAARIEYVDLFDEFTRARQPPRASPEAPLYLAQDTHWSPLGVSIAAQAAARRLRELGWARPRQEVYREQTARVNRLGDIIRMLQVPLIERSLAPESIACSQVVCANSDALYQDAADSEILVLGDSFTRIYQQDEPRSAGFVAHLAKELGQPVMALVNDGGGSTLVRQELRARPVFLRNKKVVLWEFVERDIGLGVEGWKRVSLGPVPDPSRPPTRLSQSGSPTPEPQQTN